MGLIPAGEFQMGSYDGLDWEKPVHRVYVDAFHMEVYPVTNAKKYGALLNCATPCRRWGRRDGVDVGDATYCFRFTSSASTSLDVVITLELAWKPRWAVIRRVNSSARSTLDCSKWREAISA